MSALNKKFIVAVFLISLFVIPLVCSPVYAAEVYPGLKTNAMYKYSGFLKMTEAVSHLISLELRINDVSKSDTISYSASVYFKVVDQRYEYKGQTLEQQLDVEGEFSSDELFYKLAQVNWTHMIHFNPPIDVLTVFAVHDMKRLINYWEYDVVEEHYLERQPILKVSWDIVLGAYRRIIYMEIYTAKWLVVEGSNYLTELDVSIDVSLGIVTKMRLFYALAGVSYELRLQLSDTNMFAKNTFIFALLGAIGAIIIISAVFYKIRSKSRRRR